MQIVQKLQFIKSHNEIEMETFELCSREMVGLPEHTSIYKSLVDKIGLGGQKKLIGEMNNDVIPFPKLTDAEKHVWETYASHKKDIKEYDSTVIPTDILGLIETIQQKGWFHKIQIWHETDKDIDPIVIGVQTEHDWSSPLYLIARWGLALRPFEQVVDVAKKLWKEDRELKIKAAIKTANRALEDIDDDSAKYFSGQSLYDRF